MKWEPPMISNPEFKGEWAQKEVENPEYKGEWSAPQIDNPLFDPNVAQYTDIGAIGFELWTVNNGTIFDNILVTDDLDYAQKRGKELWNPLSEGEKDAEEAWKKAEELRLQPVVVDTEVTAEVAEEKEEL